MSRNHDDVNRPIRVVVFTRGPILERGVQQFLDRLEKNTQIIFLACIAESKLHSKREVYSELWQRRSILSLPILLANWSDTLWRYISSPLKEINLHRGLKIIADRILFFSNIHAQEVLDLISSQQPELGLIYGSPILKPELFKIPTAGTLGIHHGKVPEYRGKKTMFWAIYNGEPTAGVTIQLVNAGLDTGLIVKEGQVSVGHRFPRAIWRELDQLGLDLYIQAILEVRDGTATYRPQSDRKGRLYQDPSFIDVLELWRRIFSRMIKDWFRDFTQKER